MAGKPLIRVAVVAVLAGGAFTVPPAEAGNTVRIHDIQGAAHTSPLNGRPVTGVPGVVTALTSNGFWFQDPRPDADPATSEGLFVLTGTRPAVSVGDAVTVSGAVAEFRPGAPTNLTTTEITGPAVTVGSAGNALPVTVIGKDRKPPRRTIEDDATGDAETSGVFDPATDGIDFYESLEGMRLELDDAVAVGPRNVFGEIPVLARDGAGAGPRTRRGGIVIRPDDYNPERIILDDPIAATPAADVGDHFAGPVTGVLDYNAGAYKLLVTAPPVRVPGAAPRETAQAPGPGELAIGAVTVENLAATSPSAEFDRHAGLIVHTLRSPDILTVEEVQDDNGATDDGTVAAGQTFAKLAAAISVAGGPAYQWRSIDPRNNADGGTPGGNIRVGFLFRTDRGLSFVDRPGGDATTPTGVTNDGGRARLTLSPGRIDPANAAFTANNKSLAGEFSWRGKPLIVVADHWISKGGVLIRYTDKGVDQPLFGHFQPPVLTTEAQRVAEATAVAGFVRAIRAIDRNANVVVAGDLQDFPWSPPLRALTDGTGLRDLPALLPLPERYTYILDGNSEVFDHILLSTGLSTRPYAYDVVHVNSEYTDQTSDHDPSVVRLKLG